ncbi:hypothetical protein CLIB1423_14S02036 [[Candida] railenensis]|uniref:Uncharacterized protein n=1 Tax=[Candida] railenensis TaxID=45579 RepID=A0A9P0QRC3_9ASCO|nr:hypothetical protein CLIB1423_14S02036 [[Candida] railenensis]
MSFVTITTTSQPHVGGHHHKHKREHAIITKTIEGYLVGRGDSTTETEDSLPTYSSNSSTTMSSYSTSSSSSSVSSSYYYSISEIPNTQTNAAKNSAQYDPYLYRTDLPNNILFVIIGSIIGLILLVIIAIRSVKKVSAMQRAKNDSEKYEFSQNSMYLHSGLGSSCSSMLDLSSEKMSLHSASSYYMLSKNAAVSSQSSSDGSSDSGGAGRGYRNAIKNNGSSTTINNLNTSKNADNKSRRGSMFISPVLEAMNQSRNNNFEYKLPMYHRGAMTDSEVGSGYGGEYSGMSSAGSIVEGRLLDSFINSGESLPSGQVGSVGTESETTPKRRPPSLLLDDILDALPDYRDDIEKL